MGGKHSKSDSLSRTDLDWLIRHTKYNEETFKEFLLAISVTSSGTPEEKLNWAFSMYDVDGNGWIDLLEMTKMVRSIYQVISARGERVPGERPGETVETRAESIFKRMDLNSDGRVTRQEFVRTCLGDQKLIELLTPHSQAC